MEHPLVRVFRDDFNREWEVRAVQEELTDRTQRLLSRPELAYGWLLFTSCTEHRRLDPLPPGWYVASDQVLTRWCDEGSVVTAPDVTSSAATT
jgi:hypothetical protein